jgi:16S rRNA (uracil1498-N3)-methyltransferase
MSHRRFKVEKQCIQDRQAFIEDRDEMKHISRVLRLGVGDGVVLFDGEGEEYQAVIKGMTPDRISFLIQGEKSGAFRESPLRIILAAGLLKSPRFDWLLQKTTELGVAEIIPFRSSRVIPRLEKKGAEEKHRRWQKIAAEASKQCGRTSVPTVHSLHSFEEVLSMEFASAVRIFFWEEEKTGSLGESLGVETTSVFALVGPEGGFSEREARRALEAGFRPVRLGPRTLRAETAAVVATSLVQYACGDLR